MQLHNSPHSQLQDQPPECHQRLPTREIQQAALLLRCQRAQHPLVLMLRVLAQPPMQDQFRHREYPRHLPLVQAQKLLFLRRPRVQHPLTVVSRVLGVL